MLGGTVRGKRTTLRLPAESDLALYARLAADPRVRRGGPLALWHEPAASATWKERLIEQAKDKTSVLWSIDADGALSGFVRVGYDSMPPADTAVIRQFVIDPDRGRSGLGWDAALTLHRWIFDFMALRMAAAEGLPADNAAALRILDKLGYQPFALGHAVYYRDGGYVDQHHLQMEREEWDRRWGATEREYAPLGPEAER